MNALPQWGCTVASAEFRHGARRWDVRERTFGDESRFCLWAWQQARDEFEAIRADLRDDEYRRVTEGHHADAWSGGYDWGGERVIGAAMTPAGQRELAIIAGIGAQDVDAIRADGAAWARLQALLADLNDSGPVVAGGGTGRALAFFEVSVLLADKGWRQHDIAAATRRFVRLYLATERKEGEPAFLRSRQGATVYDHEAQVRHILASRGLPSHVIEERIKAQRKPHHAR